LTRQKRLFGGKSPCGGGLAPVAVPQKLRMFHLMWRGVFHPAARLGNIFVEKTLARSSTCRAMPKASKEKK
jgi:hypothetical protein